MKSENKKTQPTTVAGIDPEDDLGAETTVRMSMFGAQYDLYPTGSLIYLLRKREEKSKGGIILPEDATTNSNIGDVVAVGEDVARLAIGHTVMFGQFSGKHVKQTLPAEVFNGGLSVDGVSGYGADAPFKSDDLMVMQEEDVIAILAKVPKAKEATNAA